MRFVLFIALVAVGTAGCRKSDEPAAKTQAAASVPEVSVDELAAMLASNAARAVDANGEATRKKLGIIPGAVLLSDYETFLPNELPPDKAKPLVFYCANTHCGASHEAAAKARTAGYTNVKVLPEGIAGWVKAGKQTGRI